MIEKKAIIASVVIFALLVLGMFGYAYLKKQELKNTVDPEPQSEPVADDPYDYISSIDAKHFFIDGTHTLVGEVLLPTACDLLNWDLGIEESFPEGIQINFSVINNSEDCEAAMTPARFMLSLDASEEAQFNKTYFEGREINLNLIPAAPGETPEDFELFIKG